jgi:hypothetical protein
VRRVKTKWVINLPDDSLTLVKTGAVVTCGHILAEKNVKKEITFNFGNEIKKYGHQLIGKKIDEGQVIYQTGGLFSKKVKAPCSGVVDRIDEFNNVYVNIGMGDKLKILSPVDAVVVKVETNNIVLEFQAEEYLGTGQNEGRAWGVAGLKYAEKLSDLNFEDADKIVFIKEVSIALLTKAQVIGIKGVVIMEDKNMSNDDRINFKLPTIILDEEEGEAVLKSIPKCKRALINAGSGRLLLVIN